MSMHGIQKFTKDQHVQRLIANIEHRAKRHRGCADDQHLLKNDLDAIADEIAELRSVLASDRNEYFY